MKLKFWGIRGSIPTPLSKDELFLKLYKTLELYNESNYYQTKDIKEFLNNTPFYVHSTYGGNTACIEINCDNELIILDAGSGIKFLGKDIMKRNLTNPVIHLFISHTHWDHICGFPFFIPNFIKNKIIKIYSPLPDLKERLSLQQDPRFFPLKLEEMAANIEFIHLQENAPVTINDNIIIKNFKLNHPGDSFAYSIEQNNKKIVYATDNEIYGTSKEFIINYKKFIQGADALIFDAQYTLGETFNKITWGHSSATMGVEMALEGNCKNLVLIHFEPDHNDVDVYNNLNTTQEFYKTIRESIPDAPKDKLNIYGAYEGLVFEI